MAYINDARSHRIRFSHRFPVTMASCPFFGNWCGRVPGLDHIIPKFRSSALRLLAFSFQCPGSVISLINNNKRSKRPNDSNSSSVQFSSVPWPSGSSRDMRDDSAENQEKFKWKPERKKKKKVFVKLGLGNLSIISLKYVRKAKVTVYSLSAWRT